MSTTVTMTMDKVRKIPPMSPERIKELENWQDEYDEDCPPCTPEELAQFKRVNPRKKTAND